MLKIYDAYSSHKDTETAVKEIANQIKKEDINYVIYFAGNKYDFELLSKNMKEAFEQAEVVGCTTAGEISKKYLTENSLVAMAISSKDFITKTTVVNDISTVPIIHREELIKTYKKSGLKNKKDGFVITLMDGLSLGEERVLSVINSIFESYNLPIIGGSAGDGLDFKETKVSYNGQVYKDAAVVTFVNTKHKFCIYKENIFKSTKEQMIVTRADINNRIVYEFNNQPAAKYYAKKLGVDKKDLHKYFITNPLGRKIGDNIWIASPATINEDDSMQFHCQVLTNSILEILEPLDPVEMASNTVQELKANISNIKGILAINCVSRKLQFQEERIEKKVLEPLLMTAPTVGFSSYGEQINSNHLNQTLILLALGE